MKIVGPQGLGDNTYNYASAFLLNIGVTSVWKARIAALSTCIRKRTQ